MSIAQTDWISAAPDDAAEQALRVDVKGYEGPLDLLLDLARRQKVDLSAISVLALTEQYLAFIEDLRQLRIEVAADYLVMAAWLAYLKSRLLVPQAVNDDEPSGEMLAALLHFRLKRLEAMRNVSTQLINRARVGAKVFARGAPEPIEIERKSIWEATLYDLLKAYSDQRERTAIVEYSPYVRTVWSLQDARDLLEKLIGETADWFSLDGFLYDYLATPEERRTARASSFASSLELVRQGVMEIKQRDTFAPIMLRKRMTSHD
ncbi:ScpA family protein [Devosia sp. MC521]|uniref:segregation and condensation protein A n=1 Tax=Devosia sp. MC521 TaxID=2759954 RepID=UPI0015FBF22B|nr:ScpA family protein [Devosia sp. MC521]MBJ6986997.1 segregation/condensation protein A [Devosia sp. MC521]QMW64017.1 segregation/condensation protein A [Devosia sp. MC521]